MELYLEAEFGTESLLKDLADPEIGYFSIQFEGEDVGFFKINYAPILALSDGTNVELEKIYLLTDQKGKGLGKAAMEFCISEAKKAGGELLHLCVIDTNISSIAFYKSLGFEFHSKAILDVPLFKEELKGMHRMLLELK